MSSDVDNHAATAGSIVPTEEMPSSTKHVFISHAAAEADIVARVRDDLEANGINCWMAPRDVPLGGDHAVAIHAAISSCPVFLLFVSKRSMASVDVSREVHLAAEAKATIIPIRLEEVALPPAIAYFLASAQRIDAIPRIEPILGRLRKDVLEKLKQHGIVITFTHRSRVGAILVTLGAWAVVLALDGLLLEIIRRAWFNMLPYSSGLLSALQTPRFVLLAAVPLLLAFAFQFWANRDPVRILTLDALFSLTPGQARVRLVGAAAILALGPTTAFFMSTVSVSLVEAAVPVDSGLVRVDSCGSQGSYTTQAETHYKVDMRVGSGNPAGDYVITLELAPYATKNGVEFCDIWLDTALASANVTRPTVNLSTSTGIFTVPVPRNAFPGRHSILFTVMHYRDSTPNATVTAGLTSGSLPVKDHEAIYTPLR